MTKVLDSSKREVRFAIPEGAKFVRCRGCGAEITFVRTRNGKRMPVDPDGTPHFATCPKATDFRRRS